MLQVSLPHAAGLSTTCCRFVYHMLQVSIPHATGLSTACSPAGSKSLGASSSLPALPFFFLGLPLRLRRDVVLLSESLLSRLRYLLRVS